MSRPARSPKASLPARAWRALLDHLRSRPLAVQRRLVYAFDLRTPVAELAAALPLRFEIRPDPEVDPGASGDEGPSDFLFQALSGVDTVYRMRIGVRRDELLHLLVGCEVPLRPVFFYDCATEPEFRGRGVYPSSLAHALSYAGRRGFETAYIRVERGNAASVAGIERAGFKPVAVVVHVSFFGISLGPFGYPATWSPRKRSETR